MPQFAAGRPGDYSPVPGNNRVDASGFMAGCIAATSSEPELTTGRVPAVLSFFGRASVSKVTAPMGKALVKTGLTPDSVTVIGTVASVAGAGDAVSVRTSVLGNHVHLVLRHVRHARRRNGSCSRRRNAVRGGTGRDLRPRRRRRDFCRPGLVGGLPREQQVACSSRRSSASSPRRSSRTRRRRAEASGLTADGGWIERPDRLIIVLVGSGLTGMGLPWAIHIGDVGYLPPEAS